MTIISLATGEAVTSLPKRCTVALGFFDGVHLGHRAILNTAADLARRRGCAAAAWMINGRTRGQLLTEHEEKLSLIASCGIDYAVTACFDDIRSMSGEEFVRDVLASSLGVSEVVCGFNFRFGKGAAWGAEELHELCEGEGIVQTTLPAVMCDGESISSSRIRQLIAAGDVQLAERLLGRPYSLKLPVISGKMLGRRLGFPTANQLPPAHIMCPPRGVYATAVELKKPDGAIKTYPGCTNVGVCPTVTRDILKESGLDTAAEGAATAERAIAETYIDGFDGDLYGEKVKVSFLKRIRGEEKFDGIEELTCQIKRDSESAVEIFKNYFEGKGERK